MAPTHGGSAPVSVTDHHHRLLLSRHHLHHGLLVRPRLKLIVRDDLNANPESNMWSMVPDIDVIGSLLAKSVVARLK
jgi:hypothetical protein